MEEIRKTEKIFISGHRGMVGSATIKKFSESGYDNILVANSNELDLRDQQSVNSFFKEHNPAYVIHLAAKVGGINANINNPAVFLYDNLIMECNIINASYKNNVKKFLFLGSSCIYPRESLQPMKEEYLLTGKLEPTNEGYAIAKIAGIKLLEGYYKQYGFQSISLMPSNIYGPNDSFDLEHAHVLSSLVKRFCDAKKAGAGKVTLWGTGIARREFLHVNDMSNAILFFFENYRSNEFINIGPGIDISIKELAELIQKKVGYPGLIEWDNTKPDGMLKKCMDVTKMKNAGFDCSVSLETGIENVIDSYNKIIDEV